MLLAHHIFYRVSQQVFDFFLSTFSHFLDPTLQPFLPLSNRPQNIHRLFLDHLRPFGTIIRPFYDHFWIIFILGTIMILDHLKYFGTILDQFMNFLIQHYLWLFKTTIQNLLVTLQKCCYLPQKSTRRQDVIEYHLTTRAEQKLSNEMKQKIRQRSLPILPSSTSSPSDNLFRTLSSTHPKIRSNIKDEKNIENFTLDFQVKNSNFQVGQQKLKGEKCNFAFQVLD